MGNVLFGNDSRGDHDRSDNVATKAECPVMRFTIHHGFQSEQFEREPKSVDETGVPGSDPGNSRSSRTEPVIDYNPTREAVQITTSRPTREKGCFI